MANVTLRDGTEVDEAAVTAIATKIQTLNSNALVALHAKGSNAGHVCADSDHAEIVSAGLDINDTTTLEVARNAVSFDGAPAFQSPIKP